MAGSTVDVIPIRNLEPSFNESKPFMARLVYKSPIKTSMKGNDKYIFIVLLDQTAEITGIAFDKTTNLHGLCEKLKINEVYCISNVTVQNASEEYYNVFPNPLELIIYNYTSIEKVEDSGRIPKMPAINFQSIRDIYSRLIGDFVSVIGVCNKVSNLHTITKSDGSLAVIRKLDLIDCEGFSITLTVWREDALETVRFWGEESHEFSPQDRPIIVARNVKVANSGNGIVLDFMGGSLLFVNPDIPQAIQLHAFRQEGGIF